MTMPQLDAYLIFDGNCAGRPLRHAVDGQRRKGERLIQSARISRLVLPI